MRKILFYVLFLFPIFFVHAQENYIPKAVKGVLDLRSTCRYKACLSSTTAIGIKMPNIGSAYELWINGKLKAKGGTVGNSIDNSKRGINPKLVLLEKDDIYKNESIEILIPVSNYHNRNGGFWSSIQFGNYNKLLEKYQWTATFDFFLLGSILIMGLYHFGLYLLRRKDPSTFWFGIFCILISLRIPLVGENYLERIFPEYSLVFSFIESAIIGNNLLTKDVSSLIFFWV